MAYPEAGKYKCEQKKAIKKQLHSTGMRIAVFGSGHTRKQMTSFEAVIRCAKKYVQRTARESPLYKWFLVRRCSPFTRLAEQFTALRALVHAMSAWSVKPDVLRPGIVGMRGSKTI